MDQILERTILQREIGIHPFELRQCPLDLFETLQVRRFQPAVFRLPVVIRGIADTMLSAEIFDFDADIRLFQDCDNLCFAESTGFQYEPPG